MTQKSEPNEVWIATIPTWFQYMHSLVAGGIWNKHTITDNTVKFEVDIVFTDRNAYDSLKNVNSITLEYRRKER